MRKQTKLVAVLSAAALLAMGASMTSFAAGWEKDDAGIWHYYDSDDEMVTGEWKKDGGKWFYLDDDGEMATDAWVDDEYYVNESGAMLVNEWKKTYTDDDMDDPDEDGESWYYFGSKGKKTTSGSKKINGKTYYFDEDGKMQYGWYADGKNVYYLGGEDDGARTSGWLWLEAPDADDDDEKDAADAVEHDSENDNDPCDEEGWYYFGSDGKMYKDAKQKKINGKYYFFNEHGQMLYEWINGVKTTMGSNAQLDTDDETAQKNATPSEVRYMNQVEEGWRADGWYQIDGADILGAGDDTDWYYFKDGKAKKAEKKDDTTGLMDGNDQVIRAKIKVNGKYFCFNEIGQMQTGLQPMGSKNSMVSGLYFFDENGYMKTGKVSNVEEENDSFTYYFETKNSKNGQGITGEKSGYLYWNGKRLEADDDYKIYQTDKDTYYLVNNKGKLQKSTSKSYEVENLDGKEMKFEFKSNYALKSAKDEDGNTVALNALDAKVPEIELYDSVITLDDNFALTVNAAK
ncbi:glucan-binding protein [uncultured Clostridium sp.]|uniref:glucan-binding protein n=1 Tax=uncultured Clostridium sp. TaxID=59620 RepID=UPI0025F30608|nr:glucan-binding protein [uncultured Clostridium sp.]